MKPLLYMLLLIATAGCKPSGRGKIDPRVLTIPAVNLLLTDSSSKINTGQIAAGQPIVLMYFNPGCAFSRQQTEDIIASYQSLQNIRFYLCSPYPVARLIDFCRQYNLNRYSNITVAQDYELFFQKQLNIRSFPWLFIYSPTKELKKITTGAVEAKTILEIIAGR